MADLNKNQALAVAHKDGPMLVLAGPGSGKTRVITERAKYLIEQYHISPSQILVITFSKKAALEMQERFRQLVDKKSYPVNFGTFHAVFFQILKQYKQYDTTSILSQQRQIEILLQIVEQMHVGVEEPRSYCEKKCREISLYKGSGKNKNAFLERMLPDEFEEFEMIFKEYEAHCRRNHKLDFDDMVLECYSLLKNQPYFLRTWQERFLYILVDEFQDSSLLQYEVIRLLAKQSRNLFVVGDDDQSIYGFRGALCNVFTRFQNDFADAVKIQLSVNYRCSNAIIHTAATLISKNKNRIAKQIVGHANEQGAVIKSHHENVMSEAVYVAEEIKRLHEEEQIAYSEIAVLYRIGSCQRAIEECLLSKGLPYCKSHKQRLFYEETFVRDIFAYLQIASGDCKKTLLFQILNKPQRELHREWIPDDFFTTAEFTRKQHGYQFEKLNILKGDLKKISQLPPYAAVNYILRKVGYLQFMRQYSYRYDMDEEDISNFIEELLSRANGFVTIEEWIAHVNDICKAYEYTQECHETKRDAVTLQTIHAAKGLEYHTVFIVGLCEGILPYKKAVSEEEIEEERRLCYVAVTRAKERLYLCNRTESSRGRAVSRFAKEMGGDSVS